MANLELGTILESPGSSQIARAGAFAADQHGRKYVLSARDAFRMGQILRKAPPIATIGTFDGPDALPGGPTLSDAVVAIRLMRGLEMAWPQFAQRAHCLPPTPLEHALGERIMLARSANQCSGAVTATHGPVRIKNHYTGTDITYARAIEATFDDIRTFERGDAGTLVTTALGSALGLLVAGTPEQAIIAPLAPFLCKHGLQLLPPEHGVRAVLRQSALDAAAAQWDSEPEYPIPVGYAA